jgi:polyisoprenoid-binding protein YceI
MTTATTEKTMSIATSEHRSDQTLSGRWHLDSGRSNVEFRARKFWGLATVKGHFVEYEGHLELSANPAVELTIAAASVHTGISKRDQHLRSAAFFDAENHPRVRFVSDSVDLHDDTLRVRGRLTVRGHSIPLELDAQVLWADGELEIEAATPAPHRELGRTWSPLGMIRPRSELFVRAHLVPATDGAT